MNTTAQKFGPPLVVLGVALYLGWPPSQPMDLGDDLIKARAVRWNAGDLEPPADPADIVDPFRPVLIVKAETKPVEEISQQPDGPSEDQIHAVVSLTGIAKAGGRSWAIVNGKAHLVGDIIKTSDEVVRTCKIVAIDPDQIVVQSQQTFAIVRPQVSPANTRNRRAAPADVKRVQQSSATAPRFDVGPPDVGRRDADPPPQASI